MVRLRRIAVWLLHAKHVEDAVDFFGALHFFGETRKHVAPLLQRAQVGDPRAVVGPRLSPGITIGMPGG